VSDHVLRYHHLMIDLAIVDGKSKADEIGQNGGGALLCAYGRCPWWRRAGFGEVEVDKIGSWEG
jgi:hypothetical protein